MCHELAGSAATGQTWRPIVAAHVACLLTCVILVARSSAQEGSGEFQLKAAFVARFPQFVEWPPDATTDARTFNLCVLAPDPFGGALTELVRGEQLRSRRMEARTIRPGDNLELCHVLFLPANLPRRQSVLRRISMLPILTISDAPQFLDEGGIVQLRLVSQRVRFDMSTEAAARAGLRISSQLLELASTVRGVPQ